MKTFEEIQVGDVFYFVRNPDDKLIRVVVNKKPDALEVLGMGTGTKIGKIIKLDFAKVEYISYLHTKMWSYYRKMSDDELEVFKLLYGPSQ